MTKVSIVGGGNAGVFTALYIAWHGRDLNLEVDLIHNPKMPPEEVGQATLLFPPHILWEALGFDWYNNPIKATFKSGILYEGWGKVNDKVFHPFNASNMAMHFCPAKMQSYILNSGIFKVTEDDVDPKDVDADYVFDCRGKPKDLSNYNELINPLNSVILSRKMGRNFELNYTRCVATPHGWTFIIPNHDSVSYGYLYNNKITSKEEAENNMIDMFDVEVTKHNQFNNYVAKDIIVDDRIFLNGNRLFFIEPLESTALQSYLEIAESIIKNIKDPKIKNINNYFQQYVKKIQNFILWHYQFGSKYDTPFWEYARSLKFIDPTFDSIIRDCKNSSWYKIHRFVEDHSRDYGLWTPYTLKIWYDGMMKRVPIK